jgi:hypothetical protein
MTEPLRIAPIRICMWSGPRNISTAMLRAFENRPDARVIDEPFYAAYLAATGSDHPLRDAVLASQPHDWREVVKGLLAPIDRAIFYQKQMTHHMLDSFGRDWMSRCRNAFLIRSPEEVLASYAQKRGQVTLAGIGFVQAAELFEREAERLGRAPPVIEARDVLDDPRKMLSALCVALDIPFSEKMLGWPAGSRATDGVWAPAWYDAVERSTGFAKPAPSRAAKLSGDLERLADAARPHYERLYAHRLVVEN